ncbi:MAG: transporter substrate-binding domain-containing protein [Acidobacteriota bacterium]|nr:transporter substrate-binding domain-containing protein [Acidobacteriota bacterium]
MIMRFNVFSSSMLKAAFSATLLRALLIVSLAAGSLLLSSPATASDLAAVRERGKLIMLSVPHQESAFVRTNIERGPMKRQGTAEDFHGVDVEIMKRFADSLGVELEVRPAVAANGIPAYPELFEWLGRGDGDIIASSLTITEQRKQRVDFSRPYHAVYPIVIVRTDSFIEAPEDLDQAIAANLPGSSQEEHLRRLGFTDERIHFKEFTLEAYDAVLEGTADFTLVDSDSAYSFMSENRNLKIAFRLPGVEDPYGYAVPKNSDLLPPLNTFLEELEESGELSRIKSRFLGETLQPES